MQSRGTPQTSGTPVPRHRGARSWSSCPGVAPAVTRRSVPSGSPVAAASPSSPWPSPRPGSSASRASAERARPSRSPSSPWPPGQTLSEIAAAQLPDLSVSNGIVAIQVANELNSAQVSAGQHLVIPAG